MVPSTIAAIYDQANQTSKRNTRASWIALRTFRQIPNVVAATAAGEPIYEIRSVRLVLNDNAAHFSRIVACSKCGLGVVGPAVMSPADLDHPVNAMICGNCVGAASLAPFSADQAEAAGGSPAPPVGAPEPQPPEPEPEPPDDGRIAALERQVAELTSALQAQRSSVDAAIEGRAQIIGGELAEALVDVRLSIAALDRDDGARIEVIEKALAERGAEIADLHDLHAALDAGLGQLRSELTRVRSTSSELAAAHDAVRDQVGRLIDTEVAAVGRGRGLLGRRAGESAAELAEVVQGLSQEQRRLLAHVADLERAADSATIAAARATAGASSFGPVRSDVKALHEQVAAQSEALNALTKKVDALKRKVAGSAPR